MKVKADKRELGQAFEEQMEAQREVRGESEWVMKVTDKWNGGKEFKKDCYSVGE